MALVQPGRIAVLALLALVPAVLFALRRAVGAVALSFACVLVIAASLYYMFGAGEPDEPPSAAP